MTGHHRVGRATGTDRSGPRQFVGQPFHPVVGQRDELTVERVRFDDVSPRLEIATVNLFDDLRLREVEQFVVTFEILALPILEPFAAELLFAQPILLDDRAHRPVEDDEALAQETRELFNSVDLGAHARGHSA